MNFHQKNELDAARYHIIREELCKSWWTKAASPEQVDEGADAVLRARQTSSAAGTELPAVTSASRQAIPEDSQASSGHRNDAPARDAKCEATAKPVRDSAQYPSLSAEPPKELLRQAVESQKNDTRTDEQKARDGAAFVMGPSAKPHAEGLAKGLEYLREMHWPDYSAGPYTRESAEAKLLREAADALLGRK